MKHVVSFSGGKDSTAMLLMMIEKGMRIDEIVCVDTSKEFPQMYAHIEKLKEYIKPYTITTVKIDFDYWLGEHIKTKGKNKGKVGYGFPDFRIRWCTALKREAVNKVKKTIGGESIDFMGIAFDEQKRIQGYTDKRLVRYPLVEMGITEKEALQYCYDKGFDWGGLYEKFTRVSCWCCPMSKIGHLKILYNEFPQLWQELRDMDKKSYRRFRNDYSVAELEVKFKKE